MHSRAHRAPVIRNTRSVHISWQLPNLHFFRTGQENTNLNYIFGADKGIKSQHYSHNLIALREVILLLLPKKEFKYTQLGYRIQVL